jgi:hypothetical protein
LLPYFLKVEVSVSFVDHFYIELFVLAVTLTCYAHTILQLALHKLYILKVTYVFFENVSLYSAGICVKCLMHCLQLFIMPMIYPFIAVVVVVVVVLRVSVAEWQLVCIVEVIDK